MIDLKQQHIYPSYLEFKSQYKNLEEGGGGKGSDVVVRKEKVE